ncbi:MAG: sulfatase-like hydrolase/transferase [Prolixibacteraceae bacterium]
MNIRTLSPILLSALHLNVWAQPDDRPNILWIVSEDNTNTFIGCYSNDYATTPNIDKLASEGVRFKNAFCTAPVCSPSRSTLISGMYPPTIGTDNMRSEYLPPAFLRFFPSYLREAGYYTSNNEKKDYNMVDQPEAWDESSLKATYKNRKPGQPFFSVFNLMITHESGIFPAKAEADLKHDPAKVKVPAYHPSTPEMRHDWAYYYDNVEVMDSKVGLILKELEDLGLAENTIVFYYSDNGGVLGRSKRFVYENGMHVPLIVRLPLKYAHLFPGYAPGSVTDRLVTFLDFAPTVLSLVGIPIPGYMQGKAFMGNQIRPEQEYAYGFRSRMDERYDLYRTVRDKKYRYIRNYMPHKIYGQYSEYLMQARSLQSWQNEFLHGRTNETQGRFWEVKPLEELYDINADPDNVNNLAGNPEYRKVLERMREENRDWIIKSRDLGFIPEAIIFDLLQNNIAPYDYSRNSGHDINKILRMAETVGSGLAKDKRMIIKGLTSSDPVIRYWAAMGCTAQPGLVEDKNMLLPLLNDPEPAVRIMAAEALYTVYGEKEQVIEVLRQFIFSENQAEAMQSLSVVDLMGEDASVLFSDVRKILDKDPNSWAHEAKLARKILNHPRKMYPSGAVPFVLP